MKQPNDLTELRRFLGMVNQMSKFSSSLAENTKPLRDLLHKDSAFLWGEAQQISFDRIKSQLCQAPTLAMYDPVKETMISADASSYGIGAELKQQQEDKSWRLRFRMRLMRYSYIVFHTLGKNLTVADTLSRAPVVEIPLRTEKKLEEKTEMYVEMVIRHLPASDAKLQQISTEQHSEYSRIFSFVKNGWLAYHSLQEEEKRLYRFRNNLTVVNGLLLKDNRLVIPKTLRPEMMEKIHAGHQGIRKCRERAQTLLW
ncbi:uncharacterized protein [Haliotis cracherodii]|uniref:uncharacterized protein n=1 Tax=Haliotis cracherodii TaxID=6455 RepID=UPI0039E9EA45